MRFREQILLAGFLSALGCGSKNDCPGMCPTDNRFPTMTIETADGAASIAKADVINGPCTPLLIRSAGEAGVPTGYASAQITYKGPIDIPPLCLIELTSLAGDSVWVTAQIRSRPYQQSCCPYATCCPKDKSATLHYDVQFDPAVQTIAFAPAVDGGQPVDAGEAMDASDESAAASTVDGGDPVDADETIDANESALADSADDS